MGKPTRSKRGRKKSVAVIFGTRPEAIKLFPVVRELEGRRDAAALMVATGQHKDLAAQAASELGLKPDVDLALMKRDQQPWEFLSRALPAVTRLISERRPDFVLVQGDTTSTLAGALGGYYCRVPVGHVEAGLRTPDIYSPYPEEVNRRLVTAVASLHFAPTESARGNLLREGVAEERVFVTGNTVVDAVRMIARRREQPAARARSRRLILLTLHRRESFGKPLRGILGAMRDILRKCDDVELVFPVHPNPEVKRAAKEVLGGVDRARLVEPLPYPAFLRLMERSYLIVTDSGGIQEEAPILGKPTLVVRRFTERGEAVEAGAAVLVGTKPEDLKREAMRLIEDRAAYERMRLGKSLFGDGKAARRIVNEVMKYLRRRGAE